MFESILALFAITVGTACICQAIYHSAKEGLRGYKEESYTTEEGEEYTVKHYFDF
jgi:hypothetical protein